MHHFFRAVRVLSFASESARDRWTQIIIDPSINSGQRKKEKMEMEEGR